ncbi:MAG: LytTR family DNA-binding domain-containing protein [Lachnospiraceae bacterium]|nr:LytTR family DNA-binding domain-containing protein [Lachnospiraceae bacterium]
MKPEHTPEPLIHLRGLHSERYDLPPSQILYVEASNINSLVTDPDQTICVRYPIGLLQEILPDFFLRIHRSFLVNRHAILRVKPYTLTLYDGTELPIPQRKYHWLIHQLEEMN